ncbi:MAG TPA: hypothetical protein VGO90_01840 [Chthoniobacteraceae bacterium]|nr:hypothetical protein [Chthoniobacteraceae bacterium]
MKTAFAILLMLGGASAAQSVLPARTDLFSDEIVHKFPAENAHGRFVDVTGDVASETRPKPDIPGYSQALLFQDGRQLRGEIVSLSATEIVWGRPDCSEPLRFPREQIRRALFREENPAFTVSDEEPEEKTPQSDRGAATLKLPGGDWLHGKLTSPDGDRFALKLAKETTLQIGREHLEWIHFASAPVAAFGYSGNALEMEGWLPPSGVAKLEVLNGTLSVSEVEGLLRPVTSPLRFEVALEFPADGEEGERLWLQPFGPMLNCYSIGTVELQFGKKELNRVFYSRNFERHKTRLVVDATEKGPVRYRVFYDGVGERLTVYRNGKQLGSWKLREEQKNAAAAKNPIEAMQERLRPVTGICLDRKGGDPVIKLNRFRVQPWDGVLPSDDSSVTVERLTIDKAAAIPGKLEAISETKIVFGGGKMLERNVPMVLHLPNTPASVSGADAMLMFGQAGEVLAAGLEISEGKARCRTSFSEAFELPVSALQTIAFPTHSRIEAGSGDVLVFRSGDELRGSLLTATESGRLRWKTSSGQEIAIETAQVAGVAFASRNGALPRTQAGTLELRSGDRLRGEFIALDEDQVRWKHAVLGAFGFPRGAVQTLFPNPELDVWEGGQGRIIGQKSEATKPPRAVQGAASENAAAACFDGHYLLRASGTPFSQESVTAVQMSLPETPERFELRVDATQAGEGEPSFTVQLGTEGNQGSVQATCSLDELQFMVQTAKGGGGPISRTVAARDRLPELSSRLNVRVFVDARQGTAHFYFDGMFIGKTGQQVSERLPGLGRTVEFTAYRNSSAPLVLSNLWIGPWSGELPIVGGPKLPRTALANGDVADAAPESLRDGRFIVQADVGALEIPAEKVQAVEFSEAISKDAIPARIRLTDGSAFGVETFRWEKEELVAESRQLGAIRLPAAMVREVVYRPAPARALRVPTPKRMAENTDPAAGEPELQQP